MEEDQALQAVLNRYNGHIAIDDNALAERLRQAAEEWQEFHMEELDRIQAPADPLTSHPFSSLGKQYEEEFSRWEERTEIANLFDLFKEARDYPASLTLDEVELGTKRTPEECVRVALRDLCHYWSTSVAEYDRMVQEGELEPWPEILAEGDLEKINPDHPLAASHRFRRIGAADFLYEIAEHAPELISERAIDELHDALFDCCAAVRMRVAETLGLMGNQSSLPYLIKLQSTESESEMCQSAAAAAIVQIQHDCGQDDS